VDALLEDPRREAAPAAVQRGDRPLGEEQHRQAVGGEHEGRGVGQRGGLPVLLGVRSRVRGRLGRAADLGAVDLAAVEEALARHADLGREPRRFSSTCSPGSSVSRPRLSEANGPSETPP
jgi:hypothetical protein